ncbi:PHD/FYVE-zinc-finger like domain-containing protein [Thelonectria olida]|uniref:PHD/FYVE-zinc-finger like domain-containing protein n=1 Tax=Thelonectria olida TaxID=1576542 RepID=A0A9P9AVZ0_9HYPO|nr:PHD/FYVE-zinc-finger like domain-containing protein [Thelonectria olida]
MDLDELPDSMASGWLPGPLVDAVQDSEDAGGNSEDGVDDVAKGDAEYYIEENTPYGNGACPNENMAKNAEGDVGAFDDDSPTPQIAQNYRIEVVIPEMSLEEREKYDAVHSNVVESVISEVPLKEGEFCYKIEYTDGREDLIPSFELTTLKNGRQALDWFSQGGAPGDMSMTSTTLKRKRGLIDKWDSDRESVASDPMELDEGESEDQLSRPQRTSTRSLRSRQRTRQSSRNLSIISDDEDLDDQLSQSQRTPSRSLRTRQTTRQSSQKLSILSDDDDLDELDPAKPDPPAGSTRTLRTRTTKQLSLTNMSFKSQADDQDHDELLQDLPRVSSNDEDADFVYVTSDLGPMGGRPARAKQRSKRLLSRLALSKKKSASTSQRKSPDSDIEFEAPRRSVRSTRNKMSMQDDALMDEDSFYVTEEKAAGAPKVISIREVFQQLPSDSAFASMHMDTCHSCGGSRQRGQLIHCQGCTLSYHKACLGYRSGRDHMATKVGEDDFVLQCRYCIGLYAKKDPNAPAHSMCQGCKGHGRACAAFSEKKTARQEEQLREENDGRDPITRVPAELLNNADIVLFRCATCHRGWHAEHLPGENDNEDMVGTDVKSERLKDYSVDWQCNDCSSAKYKIHTLVAWRRPDDALTKPAHQLTFNQVKEDNKEYLIKWESKSYVHCTWKPGAWVYGVAASTMRTSFGKRDAEQDLFRPDEKEAIPIEYITPDVVLNVKMHRSAPHASSREAELSNISHISKILVKFQGLGYDDVVWDSPPKENMGGIYEAFVDAFCEYVEGKYFQPDSQQKVRERIKEFKSRPFVEVDEQPVGLKRGKLMGYQVEGLNWLLGNYHSGRSVVLADEMGLGKTVQVVSLVTSLVQDKPKCWPFLVAVPNATCPNWRREFKQWAPSLRVVTYHGGKEPQELAYKHELFPNDSKDMKAHVVIMSYDSAADPRTKVLFKSVNWAGLVVDEGQRLKNDQNLLYVALQSMKIPFRLLLTGTPLQNNKRELFNLIQFIDSSQKAERLDEEFRELNKETLPKLHEKIRPYFLRRTKAGVLKFLPPMSQIILPVTMTVIQEKLSKSIMAKNPELIKAIFANSKMNKKERGSLNNILMQLRKCLCHPFMYSEAIEEKHHDETVLHRNLVEASAKLLLLEQMLPKLKERGHRVLIFSQFLQQLDIIEDFLTGMDYEFRRLDGTISSLEKQRRIDDFNAPGSSLFAFLLSTRAGGVGINLATADTVIILDPDFNPHQDIQALSRAHRIGQKKKVLCFQIVTKDSVEERIMQVGRKKMALDHALIESMDDDELAGDDLESILKHGAQALFDENYEKKAIHYDSAAIDNLLDRTQTEEPESAEAGTSENQYAYARVWSNDQSGFEDAVAPEDAVEPTPANLSVWDRILAEREEEARREAEANREVLGRGGRRRGAVNYKVNDTYSAPIPGEAEAESSDSSDDFAGGAQESADESDDNGPDSAKGKRQKHSLSQRKTPTSTPTPTPIKKSVKKNSNINSRTPQKQAAKTSKRTAKPQNPTPRKRGTPSNATCSNSKPKTPIPKPKSAKRQQLSTPTRNLQKAGPKKSPAVQKSGQRKPRSSPTEAPSQTMPTDVTPGPKSEVPGSMTSQL